MKVLIINRRINPTVWVPALHWCDSSGHRSVYFYNPAGADYESAVDLPCYVFEKILWHVGNLSAADGIHYLCLRREDPGLGIWIPEIDQPVKDAGELPDGCIPITQTTITTA